MCSLTCITLLTSTSHPTQQSTTWVKKESEIEAAKASLNGNDPFKNLMPTWMKSNDLMKKLQTSASKHSANLRQHAFVSNFNSLSKFRPFKGL